MRQGDGSEAVGHSVEPSDSLPPATFAFAGLEPHAARRMHGLPVLVVATVAVAALVVVAALTAVFLLPVQSRGSAWTPILQNVLTAAYQALAIGALGGLTKLVIDRRRSIEADAAEARERRRGYITSIVGASHGVDNARMLIQANRSVTTSAH